MKGSKMLNFKQKNTGFIVGSITDGKFSIAQTPHFHETWDAACIEAERLAMNLRNKKFVVLEIRGVVEACDVVWE